jgi:hypothetical protein
VIPNPDTPRSYISQNAHPATQTSNCFNTKFRSH